MTATLEDVLGDIKTRLSVITSFLQIHDKIPDSFSGRCAVVQPDPGDFIAYDPSMASESVDYRLLVTIFVPEADAVSAQALLHPYLAPSGASSVRAAVQGRNNTLIVSYVVERARNLRPLLVGQDAARYLAVDVVVKAYA